MLFGQTQSTNNYQAIHTNFKKALAPACLGLALIFIVGVLMSGCVVHHDGYGYKGHGNKKGHKHGLHKGHIKFKPKAEISVSPMIVIDD